MKALSIRVIKKLKGLPTRPFITYDLSLEKQSQLVTLCLPAMRSHAKKLQKHPYSNLEGTMMLQQLISGALLYESTRNTVRVQRLGILNQLLNDSYKALFNKDGIQTVNVTT